MVNDTPERNKTREMEELGKPKPYDESGSVVTLCSNKFEAAIVAIVVARKRGKTKARNRGQRIPQARMETGKGGEQKMFRRRVTTAGRF